MAQAESINSIRETEVRNKLDGVQVSGSWIREEAFLQHSLPFMAFAELKTTGNGIYLEIL